MRVKAEKVRPASPLPAVRDCLVSFRSYGVAIKRCGSQRGILSSIEAGGSEVTSCFRSQLGHRYCARPRFGFADNCSEVIHPTARKHPKQCPQGTVNNFGAHIRSSLSSSGVFALCSALVALDCVILSIWMIAVVTCTIPRLCSRDEAASWATSSSTCSALARISCELCPTFLLSWDPRSLLLIELWIFSAVSLATCALR